MKVEKIYRLYEVLENSDREIKWQDVVQFFEDEQDKLYEALKEKNPNAYMLYQFYLLVHDEDDRFSEEDFKHLEIDDIKSVIAQEILHAKTPQMADNIYSYFDHCPDAFQTKDEFLAYLRSMPYQYDPGQSYSNEISSLLSHYEEGRTALILGLSKYYNSVCSPNPISAGYPEIFTLSSSSMQTFLKLLSLDYDREVTSELMLKLEDEQKKCSYANSTVFHLMDCLMNEDFHSTALAKIFLNDSFEYYPEILDMIYNMIDHKAFSILYDYADIQIDDIFDKALLRGVINDVLKEENQELMDAFDTLLKGGYFERFLNSELPSEDKQKKLNLIIRKLGHDEKSKVFAELLLKMPLDAWVRISNEAEQETLEFICTNLWLYIDREIFDEEKKSTYHVFANLSNLALETNQKFVELLSFHSFLDDPKKDEILALLLSKEYEPSFDYIFNQYKEQEEILQKKSEEQKKNRLSTDKEFQVQLATVMELLDLGYSIDAVLDGFTPDDDITAKTLIRSMKYKESC